MADMVYWLYARDGLDLRWTVDILPGRDHHPPTHGLSEFWMARRTKDNVAGGQ